MPFRRKTSRRPKKRPVTRTRKSRIPRSVTTYNTNVGISTTKNVTLTYYDNIGFTPTSGIAKSHTFTMSGIYDPDITGTGHQPYGHDQWALMYKHYIVKSAKITVRFSNIATNNIPHKVSIILDKDNVIDASRNTRMERTKGKSTATLLANSNNVQTVSAVYNVKKFFDFRNSNDSHQVKALMTANPTLPAYALVVVQPYDQVSTSATAIYGEVTINYNVTLMDPIPFAGS